MSHKKLAILGFAFKKDTNDTRESAAIYVCRDILEERAELSIYDPKVEPSTISRDLKTVQSEEGGMNSQIDCIDDPYTALEGAHAFLVLTEWDESKDIDFQNVYDSMPKPAFVFDGRGILDHEKLREIGFETYRIGRGWAFFRIRS